MHAFFMIMGVVVASEVVKILIFIAQLLTMLELCKCLL
jgi:hypothetical protein